MTRLINARVRVRAACECALTEKACTVHGLKGAWHRAVIIIKQFLQTVIDS